MPPRMCSRIPDLFPPDASSTPSLLSYDNQTVSNHCQISVGTELPLLENCLYTGIKWHCLRTASFKGELFFG